MIMPVKSKHENMLEDYTCALANVFQGRTDKPSYPYRNALLERDRKLVEALKEIYQGSGQPTRDYIDVLFKFIGEEI